MNVTSCPHCQQKTFAGLKKIWIGPNRSVRCSHCQNKVGVLRTKAWLALSPFLLALGFNFYSASALARYLMIAICTLTSSLLYIYWLPLEKR